jgi:hypothetical protein
MPPGEFTRRFDRDIMHRQDPNDPNNTAEVARQRDQALQLDKVFEILEHRWEWLSKRFSGITRHEVEDGIGQHFRFPDNPDSTGAGWLEFRCKPTGTDMGYTLECVMSIEDVFKRRFDYIRFPKLEIDQARAKSFIETKLLEFAESWQS